MENARNERMTREQGLDGRVEVTTGSYEDVPVKDSSIDLVWSQDAFLHSGSRETVLDEIARVLRPGGPKAYDVYRPGRVRRSSLPSMS